MTTPDFISFVDALDGCWMQGRFEDLNSFLAEDVVLVAPGGKPRIEGIAPAIDSYRQFVSHARVDRFTTRDHVVTQRGDAAIVEYEWEMAWVTANSKHSDVGRDVLVLVRRNENWRVVWRTQIPITK